MFRMLFSQRSVLEELGKPCVQEFSKISKGKSHTGRFSCFHLLLASLSFPPCLGIPYKISGTFCGVRGTQYWTQGIRAWLGAHPLGCTQCHLVLRVPTLKIPTNEQNLNVCGRCIMSEKPFFCLFGFFFFSPWAAALWLWPTGHIHPCEIFESRLSMSLLLPGRKWREREEDPCGQAVTRGVASSSRPFARVRWGMGRATSMHRHRYIFWFLFSCKDAHAALCKLNLTLALQRVITLLPYMWLNL